jgi:hypothetical protein
MKAPVKDFSPAHVAVVPCATLGDLLTARALTAQTLARLAALPIHRAERLRAGWAQATEGEQHRIAVALGLALCEARALLAGSVRARKLRSSERITGARTCVLRAPRRRMDRGSLA